MVNGEITRATGRDISYVPVTAEQYAAAFREAGLPPDYAAELTDRFREVLDGRSAHTADGVQRALGRKPRDFAQYAREVAATGVWDGGPR